MHKITEDELGVQICSYLYFAATLGQEIGDLTDQLLLAEQEGYDKISIPVSIYKGEQGGRNASYMDVTRSEAEAVLSGQSKLMANTLTCLAEAMVQKERGAASLPMGSEITDAVTRAQNSPDKRLH